MVTIYNLPEYAFDHPFVVARYADGTLWFWGAYDWQDEAYDAAYYESGEVFPIAMVRGA